MKSKKTRVELQELYTNVMEYLKPLNINFILFYGTLLGYHRESNFIEGDDDIDTLVSIKEFNEIEQFLMKNTNPLIRYNQIIYSKTKREIPNVLQINYKDLGPFDICGYALQGDSIFLEVDHLFYKFSDIFPLKTVRFRGFVVSIPSDVEKIIILTYGNYWKTPKIKHIEYIPRAVISTNIMKLTYTIPKIKIKLIK